MRACMCIGTSTGMCTGACAGLCVSLRIGTSTDMRVGMCMRMYLGMCVGRDVRRRMRGPVNKKKQVAQPIASGCVIADDIGEASLFKLEPYGVNIAQV